jgi:WD40 repeat protein
VVFTAAAVAVIQNVETGAQEFYNNHTDDITCCTVHYAGKIAATGQMGKPCYALVWDIDTQETMYRIGDDFFDRMVEALAISPNERYLVGVSGDNNQSFGIFDLKNKNDAGEIEPIIVSEGQFSPGVPPMLTFLEWKPDVSRKRQHHKSERCRCDHPSSFCARFALAPLTPALSGGQHPVRGHRQGEAAALL